MDTKSKTEQEETLKEFEEEKKGTSEYCKVKIFNLLISNSFNCDLYISLNPNKYVKVWNKDELYSNDDLQKFVAKGVEHVYIKREDFEKFTAYYIDFLNKLMNLRTSSIESRLKFQITVSQLVMEYLANLQIGEKFVNQINETARSIVNLCERDELGLFDVLKRICSGKNFLSDHSLLLSYVTCHVAKKVGWGTEGTYTKLVMASLFHDASLVDHPHLSEIMPNRVDMRTLSRIDRNLVMDHPVKIVEKIRESIAYVPDVDFLILEHHELPDGTGFPRQLRNRYFSQISALFAFCETYISELLSRGFDKKEDILVDLRVVYHTNQFDKIFEALKR